MPGARWFPGARLNFAEHVLRNERPGAPALLYSGEGTELQELGWDEFARQVRAVATHLRGAGRRSGGPGGRLPAERAGGHGRDGGDGEPRGRLGQRVTRLRPPRRAGPARPARAAGAVRLRRLPLRRQGVRPAGRGGRTGRRAAEPARGRARAGARSRRRRCRLGRRRLRADRARRGVRLRAGAVRPPAVGALLLRHHRAAQGDRARARRHPAGAAQGPELPPGSAARRPRVLLHHHRLDDVELPGQHAAARGDAGALRRQSQPPRRRRRSGGSRRTAGPSCSGPARPSSS